MIWSTSLRLQNRRSVRYSTTENSDTSFRKKEKEARKKQKITQIKEIRVSTFIEGHDLQVKAKNAAKFLRDGDKVKVSLRFKGREKGYASVGQQVMEQFAQDISEVGVVEKKPQLEGRNMTMVLAPKNN